MIASLLLAQSFSAAGGSNCEAAGFLAESLACSKCESLAKFVKDEALVSLCGGCCKNDTDAGKVYRKAKLEVCQ